MLVLTRRPGETVLIGDAIEIQIVDVDHRDLDMRCAVSVIDEEGYELPLRCTNRRDGVALVRLPPQEN